jgi:hypothetical protein
MEYLTTPKLYDVTLLWNSMAMSVRIHGGLTLEREHWATNHDTLEIIHISMTKHKFPIQCNTHFLHDKIPKIWARCIRYVYEPRYKKQDG